MILRSIFYFYLIEPLFVCHCIESVVCLDCSIGLGGYEETN